MRCACWTFLCVLAAATTDGRFLNRATARESHEALVTKLDEATRNQCRQILNQAVRGDAFWPAMHAAEGLTAAGHASEARQALEDRLDDALDDQQRCGVFRELARTGDLAYASELVAILSGVSATAHVHAAESLYKIGEIGDGGALRTAAAQTRDPILRIMASAALTRAGSPAALAALRSDLEAGNAEVRGLAAWALARLGDSQDIGPLEKSLSRAADELAQCYAVNALAALGEPRSQQRLGVQLDSKNAEVRAQSAEIVGVARASAWVPKLQSLLNDPELDVRVRAAQALLVMAQPPAKRLPDDIRVTLFTADKERPRYTEGSVLRLRNGELLAATTEFRQSSDDFAPARIVGRRSNDGGQTWGPVASLQENTGKTNVMSVTLRRLGQPAWQTPSLGRHALGAHPIGMFYLQKDAFDDLHAYVRISQDEGATFGEPLRITSTNGYHVLNNDRITRLSSGRLLAPVAMTSDVVKENHFVSLCFLSDDAGRTWRPGAGRVDQPQRGAMEPEVVELSDGRVMMIVRTQLGYPAAAYSTDGGDHWSAAAPLPVRSPEAPATLRRIPATGHLVLVWNNAYDPAVGHGGARTPLTAAISTDDGKTWRHVRDLETRADRTYSYVSLEFVHDRVVMSYWEGEPDGQGAERYSALFRSLPLAWFYQSEQTP